MDLYKILTSCQNRDYSVFSEEQLYSLRENGINGLQMLASMDGIIIHEVIMSGGVVGINLTTRDRLIGFEDMSKYKNLTHMNLSTGANEVIIKIPIGSNPQFAIINKIIPEIRWIYLKAKYGWVPEANVYESLYKPSTIAYLDKIF